jgi:hypothetical protein
MSTKYIPIDKIITRNGSKIKTNIVIFIVVLSVILIICMLIPNNSSDNKNFIQFNNETSKNNSDSNEKYVNSSNIHLNNTNLNETKKKPDKVSSPEPDINYPDPEILKFHKLPAETDTKCLDGTPYGIYYHPGVGSGSKSIVMNFWAQNWCNGRSEKEMLDSCTSRLTYYYGSSNYLKNEYPYGYDFLGGLEEKNKYFYNWHRFDFPYCDGTGGQGHHDQSLTSSRGKKLFFRGYKNTMEGIKFIFQKVKIEEVQSIVITGCSSGGSTALLWAEYIQDLVREKNPTAIVYAVAIGGFFLDLKNLRTNDHDFALKMKEMYSVVNKEGYDLNVDCLKDYKNEPHLCLIPEYLMKYVKVPVLLLQALYDSWQLWDILEEKCVNDYKNLNHCNDSQKKNVIDLKNYTKKKLEIAVKQKKNLSVWSPACVFHCYDNSLRGTSFYEVRGVNIDQVLGDFLKNKGEKQIVLIDELEWPNNQKCSFN